MAQGSLARFEHLVISKILSVGLSSKLSVLLESTSHFLAPGNGTVKQAFELEGVII